MKIEKVEAIYIKVPLSYVQIHETVPSQTDHGTVLTKITCDNGIVGFGRTYGNSVAGPYATMACVREFTQYLIGEDPTNIQKIWLKLEIASHYLGRYGVAFAALSTIDIALWDIFGKSVGLPIYKLLGQAREECDIYSSEGWVYLSEEELVEQLRSRREEGYRAFKLRLPAKRSECVRKMRAVRDLVGADFDLMIDVQNTWNDTATAVQNANAIKEFEPYWIEEPVGVQDFEGHAEVFRSTGVPVAGGEHLYSKHFVCDALRKKAFNYVQTDAMRIGGISDLQKIVGMAESFFVPVVPHGACDIHVHVALAHKKTVIPYLELLTDSEAPLLSILYQDYQLPVNGKVYVPTKPGLGYTLNDDAIREFTATEAF